MKLLVFESFGDVLALLGSAIGAVVLTGIGFLAERAAVQNLLSGELVLGAWELWVGTVLLFFGVYLMGYGEFWRRLQRARHPR